MDPNETTETKEVMQVNITSKVNSKSIRREMLNGREHIVVPSATLPFGVVMNGGLYNRDQIEANYKKLDNTLAPLGHPTVNGQFVSALSPEGLNIGYVGAWNRNAKIDGNRVRVEKWIDIEVAKRSEGGRALLERIEAVINGTGEPIHTSVAVFLEKQPAPPGAGYDWVANIHNVDHDAILLDEPGAATPDQGVGLMVNADQAVPLQGNSGALIGESYREKENRLTNAAKERFAAGTDEYAWVADFTDSQAVIVRNGGTQELYGYTDAGGKITFDQTGIPVERQESWVKRSPVINHLIKFFSTNQARPDNSMEGDMPLTAEEKAGLVTDIGAAVAANVAEQLKPLTDKVEALEVNQQKISDSLTANQRAEEESKRTAVAAKFGKDVAEGLTGNALDALYKQCDEAAPITNGATGAQKETGAPDLANYLKGA